MIRVLFMLAMCSNLLASSSHHHGHKKKGPPKAYKGYVLNTPAAKDATAVYYDTCDSRLWKQDAKKKKACPYCGDAMPNCGWLVKVVPKRGVEYKDSDFDLPNKICPVSGEEVENKKYPVKLGNKTAYLCCKGCLKKYNKAAARGKLDKYLRKLPLKPEKFGYSKTGASHHDHGGHDHDEDDHSDHDDHHGDHDHGSHDHSGHDH